MILKTTFQNNITQAEEIPKKSLNKNVIEEETIELESDLLNLRRTLESTAVKFEMGKSGNPYKK